MKKVFGIALIMALLAGGISVNAQDQTTTKKDKTEQCDKTRKCDKDKKGNKECGKKHNKQDKMAKLFAGITLSAEQQTKLDAVKSECKAQAKADKANRQEMKKEDRAARQAACDAKIKEILTPEQWAVYQKNVETMKANRQKKNK